MDELTLAVLKAEVAEDCRILAQRHAYDLTLKKNKLSPLLDSAERVSALIPAACDSFFKSVHPA